MALNNVRNIAIVGVGGHVGTYVTRSLLQTGRHRVTAITRADSNSRIPEGVETVIVDYDKPETIVKGLQSQEALIITLGLNAKKGAQEILVRAAAEANVSWIVPSEWSPDSAHPGLVRDLRSLTHMPVTRDYVKQLGKKYIAVNCGLWYEWCLAAPDLFGIDCFTRKATLFDEGKRKVSVTTWPQIGRAIAALFSLPITADPNRDASLESFANRQLYISSFTISQQDMLDSVMRVTNTNESDWTISKVSAQERFQEGLAAPRYGTPQGRKIYTRIFFEDDAGNHDKRLGTANKILDLPSEDLDEATKVAIEMQRQRNEQS